MTACTAAAETGDSATPVACALPTTRGKGNDEVPTPPLRPRPPAVFGARRAPAPSTCNRRPDAVRHHRGSRRWTPGRHRHRIRERLHAHVPAPRALLAMQHVQAHPCAAGPSRRLLFDASDLQAVLGSVAAGAPSRRTCARSTSSARPPRPAAATSSTAPATSSWPPPTPSAPATRSPSGITRQTRSPSNPA
jgi:hypothetical protein